MHVPKHFQVHDRAVIESFIKEIGLGTLVTKGSAYPLASHVPIELETNDRGEKVLWGHVSKANEQWKDFTKDPDVLVIFLSPVHQYISSSWYNHPNAPTWNYLSVHISGKLKILEGDALWESVRRLTDRYEKNRPGAVSLDTLPASVQKQMNGIVGFEISIDRVEAAFKLSQNRNAEDFQNILRQLRLSEELTAGLMADLMERYS